MSVVQCWPNTNPNGLAAARRHYQAGEFQQVVALCLQLVREEPGDPELWCFLGEASQALGLPGPATAHYQAALRLDPGNALANNNLGVLHMGQGRLDEATGGRMVLTASLGEFLAERGKTLAVVSSGSTGSALLANPRATKGVGILVNGFWEPGRRVAFPDAVNAAILHRFPPAPQQGGARDPFSDRVVWTQQVLRDYVLPELKPDVIVNWPTEPIIPSTPSAPARRRRAP